MSAPPTVPRSRDAADQLLLGAARRGGSSGDAASRPRILYVSASPPVPSKIGPARRNFHVLDQLSRFFDVTLLSVGSQQDAALAAAALGARIPRMRFAPAVRGARRKFLWKAWRTATGRCDYAPAHEPALRAACAELARREAYDAIVLSCVLLRDLPLPDDVPIVGDTHNVEFDVLRRMAATADSRPRRAHAALQWRVTRRAERRAAHGVSLLLATSERDGALFAAELGAPRVAVVPNGIALGEFTPARGAGRPDEILFSGLMSYYPNQQAVRWFLDEVFPALLRRVPTATLTVAGAAPPRWLRDRAGDRVRVTGAVPDMRPHLEAARVFVAPLRIGGGTRVKILEAMAVGRPVVSTRIGAEGIAVRHGESILLADDAESFAGRVADALTDRALAARLVAGGRRHVARHHDWDRIGEHLRDLLRPLVADAPADATLTPR